MNDLGARELSAAPTDVFGRSRLVGQVLLARLTVLSALVGVGSGAVVIVAPNSVGPCLVIAAIALTMAASGEWVLRGLERMTALGNVIALGGIITLIGSAVLFATGGSAVAGLTVILAGELAATFASWVWANTALRVRPDWSLLHGLLRRSWPLALSTLALYSYYANLDTILLAAIRSPEEAGLYSAPYRVFLGLNAISIYTAFAFLPSLTRAVKGGDHGRAFRTLHSGVRYLLTYGVLVLAVAITVGGDFLATLFGDEFGGMGDVFVLLCIAIMWFSVGYPLGYGLIALDRNRRYLAGAATGGILNLALNVGLIPPFGMIGAAVATAVAFAAACLVWCWGRGLLGRELALELAVMSVTTLAAVAGLLSDELRLPSVALIASVGLALALDLYREPRGPDDPERDLPPVSDHP